MSKEKYGYNAFIYVIFMKNVQNFLNNIFLHWNILDFISFCKNAIFYWQKYNSDE